MAPSVVVGVGVSVIESSWLRVELGVDWVSQMVSFRSLLGSSCSAGPAGGGLAAGAVGVLDAVGAADEVGVVDAVDAAQPAKNLA